MQQAIDAGQRSRMLDADDLIDVLLALADELDPPVRGAGNTKRHRRKPTYLKRCSSDR